MARELPIHNGRMTTDLDANGFKINNLPPGSGFTQVQSDWSQADSTAPDFIKNKPTIPTPVAVDATLAVQGAAADAKAVGDALDGKLGGICVYPVWVNGFVYYVGDVVFHNGQIYRCLQDGTTDEPGGGMFSPWADRTIDELKQDRLSSQQIGNIDAVPGKADKAEPSAAGNLAAINAQGNLTDSGVKPSDFAAPSDLPYRLVTPGKWEFSGVSEENNPSLIFEDGSWQLHAEGLIWRSGNTSISAMSVDIDTGSMFGIVTATRPSLPGYLCDRAGNRVVVSGDTTLTLPAAVPGHLRDFLVRLEISGSTVPTITFAAPTGETITYETDGDEFPVPDEAGDWLYSFTESCVAHTFAVSLKKVNEVAQGGA